MKYNTHNHNTKDNHNNTNKPNQQQLQQDHLRLATIHKRKIRILRIEQKLIIQSKAENPKQFLMIVYFAAINSHPASFTLLHFSSLYLNLLHSATHHVR
jgi:hypothetical protein